RHRRGALAAGGHGRRGRGRGRASASRPRAGAALMGRALAPAPEARPTDAAGLLAGKRLVVTGVMTRNSIAFAAAERAQLAGAELVLTGFGRARRMTERAARQLPEPP